MQPCIDTGAANSLFSVQQDLMLPEKVLQTVIPAKAGIQSYLTTLDSGSSPERQKRQIMTFYEGGAI